MTETSNKRDWFAIFRILFGALIIFGAVRFFYRGWINELYITPQFHFTFPGVGWIKVMPPALMYLVFSVMGSCGLLIAFNQFFRTAIIVFFVLFTYVELIDVTYYLNHYYLVSLLSFILIFYDPRASSSSPHNQRVIFFLKLQISVVYFFGGVNKLEHDWLVRAQPLQIWLHAKAGLPVVGPWLTNRAAAFVVAYAGVVFDLAVPFLLWHRKTVLPAYLALCVFHIATAVLFQIGLFPWIMMTAALLFFHDAPPRRELFRRGIAYPVLIPLFLLTGWQVLFPSRHFVYPGNYLWTERGFRFAWNIMLMEKDGTVEFGMRKDDGAMTGINLHEYLTPFQIKMMSTQPDLIQQFARHVKKIFPDVAGVYAECHVALNGRPSKLFFDPTFNLLKDPDEFYKNIRLYTVAP